MMKSQNPNLKTQTGFTLIELIVVFSVIAILSTIGTVSLVSYSRAQVLSQTTSDLVQALNTAKSLSASQLKTLNKNGKTLRCQNFQTLGGYGVQINAAQKYYALYMECVASGIETQNTSVEWQTKFPDNVTVDPATNATDVFFPVLSGGIIAKGSSTADSVVLKSYGNTKTIKIINGYVSVL